MAREEVSINYGNATARCITAMERSMCMYNIKFTKHYVLRRLFDN
jgi:hypothetical protein